MGEADNPPIGTGPFKFVSWDRSGQFVMRRNENYWGQAPKIDEVIYKNIQEDAARIAALEAGQADIVNNLPPHEVERLNLTHVCACSRCRVCGRFFGSESGL